jgi:RNA polymerase sigma-70 factor (ECF subfamily)
VASLAHETESPVSSTRAIQTSAFSAPKDFEHLYAENFDFVWRSVRTRGVPDAAAEDVCQEVFMIAHRKLPDLVLTGSIRGWLYGIARRVSKDFRRAAKRRGPHEDLGTGEDLASDEDLPEQLMHRQTIREMNAFVAKLDEPNQELFFLSMVEGLPVNEVAAILNLNANTAYSRVRQLRINLAKHLSPEPEGTTT